MTLDDLPDFRDTVVEFEASAEKLMSAINVYASHGVLPFNSVAEFNIARALFYAREALGIKTE